VNDRSVPAWALRNPFAVFAVYLGLVLAALGTDPVEIVRPLDSEDTRALVRCLESMGARFLSSDRGLRVRGPVGKSGWAGVLLHAGSSGTAARFLTAAVALGHGSYMIDGSERMRQRPIQPLLDGLRQLGVAASAQYENGCPPVVVNADGMPGGFRADVIGLTQEGQEFVELLGGGVDDEVHVLRRPGLSVVAAGVRPGDHVRDACFFQPPGHLRQELLLSHTAISTPG